MRRAKIGMGLLAVGLLAGCDNGGTAALQVERADSTYRAAMDDYQAGRIPQALAGLKKACAANPSNASARFQLACLLQDSQKDYLGAFCAYREYLLQRPDSDKAKLAADRLSVCEREMAMTLAKKYASQATQDALRAAQESRAAQSKTEADCAKLVKACDAAKAELESLRRENARLKNLMREDAGEKPRESLDAEIAEARSLKEEATASKAREAEMAEARSLKEEAGADKKRNDEIADAKKLLEADADEAQPALEQKPGVQAKGRAAGAPKAPKYQHEARPSTYVVQEGDTLYKIAVRFYGHASAWNRIREANRATISTDGRVRKGQKLVLPAGE